jgi:GAF domain-containing protein
MAAKDRHGLASGLLEVMWTHAQPEAVAVYVRDPVKGVYTVLSSRGFDPHKIQDLTSGQGAAGRCAATGKPVVNEAFPLEERSRLATPNTSAGLGQMAFPVRAGAEVLGVLEIIGGKTGADDDMLGLIADTAALALSRLQEQERATKLAQQAERLLSERDAFD